MGEHLDWGYRLMMDGEEDQMGCDENAGSHHMLATTCVACRKAGLAPVMRSRSMWRAVAVTLGVACSALVCALALSL